MIALNEQRLPAKQPEIRKCKMASFLGLLALTYILWVVSNLIQRRYKHAFLLATPFFSVILFQFLVYLELGYRDPFALVASVTSLFVSILFVAMFEFVYMRVVKSTGKRISDNTNVFVIFSLFVSLTLASPMLSTVFEGHQRRAWEDEILLAEAKSRAGAIVESELGIEDPFELETYYVKNKHYAIMCISSDLT